MADVNIQIKGTASDLRGELSKVESSLDDVKRAAKETGDGIGGMGDKADVSEQRIMGVRDMIDGAAAVMKGPGEEGISAYLQGWADMASGVANFVAPALAGLKAGVIGTAKAAITSAGQHVVAVGRQVAAWVVLGAQSLLHAAKVAAAWLIAMGPIALIIAAVVGLVALIIANWETIKQVIATAWEAVKRGAKAAWDWIKNAVKTAVDFVINLFKNFTLPGLIVKHWDSIKRGVSNVADFIKDVWNGVIGFFTGLPGRIGSAVGGMWDGIKSAFRSAINWIIDKWNNLEISLGGGSFMGIDIPKITIRTPNIPRFHSGGVFRAPMSGGEGLALLRDRETVVPAGGSGAMSLAPTVIQLVVDRRVLAEVVREDLLRLQRRNGTTGIL